MPDPTTTADLRTLISNLAGDDGRVPDNTPDEIVLTFFNTAIQCAEAKDAHATRANFLIAMHCTQAKMDALPEKDRLRYENKNPFGLSRKRLREHLTWTRNMVDEIIGGSVRYTNDEGQDTVITPSLVKGMFLAYHLTEDKKSARAVLMLREKTSVVDVVEVPLNRFRTLWSRTQAAPPGFTQATLKDINESEEDDGDGYNTFHAPFRVIEGHDSLPEDVPDEIISRWADHPGSFNYTLLIENTTYWRRVLNRPPVPAAGGNTHEDILRKMASTVRRTTNDARVIYRYLLGGSWFMWVWMYDEPCPFSIFIQKGAEVTPDIADSKTPVRPDDFERVWQIATEITDAETNEMFVQALGRRTTPIQA